MRASFFVAFTVVQSHREEWHFPVRRERTMSLLLLIIIILLLVGGLPRWGYHSYGYGPSGLLGVVLIVLLILLLTGRL
jgi:hypothetical protein